MPGEIAKMNELKLQIDKDMNRASDYWPVEIFIDGISLIDLVTTIEKPYAVAEGAPQIAGSYASLPLSTARSPSRHLLGSPLPIFSHQDKVAILMCECGCEGCWDFVCKITFLEDTVIWSDFEQVHRDWDYAELGAFVFNRECYECEFEWVSTHRE